MSILRLLDIFRRETGATPLRYHNQCRMSNVCRLLLRDEFSIEEIAQACGFDDPLYFSKAFRKTVGLSPREFRRKQRDSL